MDFPAATDTARGDSLMPQVADVKMEERRPIGVGSSEATFYEIKRRADERLHLSNGPPYHTQTRPYRSSSWTR